VISLPELSACSVAVVAVCVAAPEIALCNFSAPAGSSAGEEGNGEEGGEETVAKSRSIAATEEEL
jgi:hypothetical protein